MDNLQNHVQNIYKNEQNRLSEADFLHEIENMLQKPQNSYHFQLSNQFIDATQKTVSAESSGPTDLHFYKLMAGSINAGQPSSLARPTQERHPTPYPLPPVRDNEAYHRLQTSRLNQHQLKNYDQPQNIQNKAFISTATSNTGNENQFRNVGENTMSNSLQAENSIYQIPSYKNKIQYDSDSVVKAGLPGPSSTENCENSSVTQNVVTSKNVIYTCEFCDFSTSCRYALEDHILIHGNYQNNSVVDLSQLPENSRQPDDSMKPVSSENILSCSLCSFRCITDNEMVKHSKEHMVVDSTACEVTSLKNDGVSEMVPDSVETSPATANTKMLKCYDCDFAAVNSKVLREHTKIHSGEELLLKCSKCPYSTCLQKNFSKHLLSHMDKEEYKCDTCNFICFSVDKLRNHVKSHSTDKSHKCSICPYQTSEKGHMTKHIRTHTGEKIFSCSFCQYSTGEKGNLTKHIKTHTGERNFICQVCNYSTSEMGNFTKHIKTHTGEKNLKCDICSYCTSDQGNLAKHKRTHTREKKFKCDICSFATHEKANLNKHMRIHKSQKMFSCKFCPFNANSYKHLVCHLELHVEEKIKTCRNKESSSADVWEPECIVKTECHNDVKNIQEAPNSETREN